MVGLNKTERQRDIHVQKVVCQLSSLDKAHRRQLKLTILGFRGCEEVQLIAPNPSPWLPRRQCLQVGACDTCIQHECYVCNPHAHVSSPGFLSDIPAPFNFLADDFWPFRDSLARAVLLCPPANKGGIPGARDRDA